MSNSDLMAEVNAKTRLAGSNKLEILLFHLGTGELMGLNVFKIKEVIPRPHITRAPHMPKGVAGLFSLRGNVLPALDLGYFTHAEGAASNFNNKEAMIVTEYSQSVQGFLVNQIDKIIRVDWDQIKSPKNVVKHQNNLVTAITELASGELISIIDVEKVLFEAFGEEKMPDFPEIKEPRKGFSFFADDSSVARKKITEVLDRLGIKHQHAENGADAWVRLQALALQAESRQEPLSKSLKLILTDAEMPEMDGYVLTKMIKADSRFSGIPVLMHSSLSSEANRVMGQSVGVDGYIAKFDPITLAESIHARWDNT